MTPGTAGGGVRRDLDAMVAGAIGAADPESLTRDALAASAVAEEAGSGVVLAAVGKASGAMARGGFDVLGGRIRAATVVMPRTRGAGNDGGDVGGDGSPGSEGRLSGLPEVARVFRGGHPLPDEDTVRGAEAVLDLVADAAPDERMVFLLSGGASALLTLPAAGVTLGDVARTTRLLMEAGADIVELNAVRKHLDRLKGGGLARAAAPTPVWAGILSDVVGDRLDVIGSGPVSPDSSTFPDALRVVQARISSSVPPRVLRHLKRGARGELPETPGEAAPCFRGVEAVIVGNAATAVAGAARAARKRGYVVRGGSHSVTGEARAVGRQLGARARRLGEEAIGSGRPTCFLSAGETTVTVTGTGRGGPNQEVALAAALELARAGPPGGAGRAGSGVSPVEVVVASVGTDGIDGPTPAAGAVVDPDTVARARAAGLSPEDALDDNDSHGFFRVLGDLLTTGPTGTNVMDLHLVLARPLPGPPEG